MRASSRVLPPLLTVLLAVATAPAPGRAASRVPLDGRLVPRFVDPLPALEVIRAGADPIELHMVEFPAQVLPAGMPATWTWGYLRPGQASSDSYTGPVIVATRGQPTEIRWVNDLGSTSTTHLAAYSLSTDQTIHWADPLHDGANDCAHMVMPPGVGWAPRSGPTTTRWAPRASGSTPGWPASTSSRILRTIPPTSRRSSRS